MSVWYVYLLLCNDNTCYCGITTNIQRRLDQHNGKIAGGARYTRSRRPLRMLGYISAPTKSHALKFEAFIKKLPRKRKIETFIHQSCLP